MANSENMNQFHSSLRQTTLSGKPKFYYFFGFPLGRLLHVCLGPESWCEEPQAKSRDTPEVLDSKLEIKANLNYRTIENQVLNLKRFSRLTPNFFLFKSTTKCFMLFCLFFVNLNFTQLASLYSAFEYDYG